MKLESIKEIKRTKAFKNRKPSPDGKGNPFAFFFKKQKIERNGRTRAIPTDEVNGS